MASIRKRGNTFTLTAYMGYNANGKQIKKTLTFRPPDGTPPGKAEKLAKKEAIAFEEKVKGYVHLNENQTFEELVAWYYENIAPQTLKPNILSNNKNIIDTYAMPMLAKKKLKDIGPALLDRLFCDLKKNGRVRDTYRLIQGKHLPKGRNNKYNISSISRYTGLSRHTIMRLSMGHGIERKNAEQIANLLQVDFYELFESDVAKHSLSNNTVARVKNCLSAIFNAAVKKEILTRNPCKNTVPINCSRSASSYLDKHQSEILLSALEVQKDYQFKVMISTLLFTGMRGGELCGLQWDDINLDVGIIHIRHTLAYIKAMPDDYTDKKTIVKTRYFDLQSPKTKSSIRYIVIPPSLLPLLKEHKKRCEQQKEERGDAWNPFDMVFLTIHGNFYSEQYLNAKFKKFIRKIGLPQNIHIHSLRHTTASLLINSNVSPKLIAEQLGHANTGITQDIYSHIFHASKAKVAQALELSLNGPQVADPGADPNLR